VIELAKRYYWLKLQKDFFKRHDIRIIEAMPNGKDYILFYLKMLVESVSHDGELRFSETIPYNEEMLATVTNTNVDVVRSAMKVFIELGMMEVLDDKTIYMAEVQKMIGSETDSAERMRKHRKRIEASHSDNDVQNSDIDIDIEKDIDINNIYGDFFEQCWSIYPNKKGKGKISDAKKRKLYEKVGLEQMIRCIERYKSYCDGKDMQFVMYGSTFFNSGYVDYLDENYNDGNSAQILNTPGGDDEWQG